MPSLEHRHEVIALTLAGHAGGPPITGPITATVLADAVERALDEAGWQQPHVVGNSLGGFVALQLAARGRAATVTALAPAGGWAAGDTSFRDMLRMQRMLQVSTRAAAPHAEAILASRAGRRRASELITVNFEHIPTELLVHQLLGVAACTSALEMIDFALREGYELDAERLACPVRIVWGTEDRILPWPSAATRFRDGWLAQADWVELEGVGHCPQLDVPLETAQLILGFTGAGY